MKKQTLIKITVSVITLGLFTSCGASKSNQFSNQTTSYEFSSQQSQLANCNRMNTDKLTLNLSVVTDSGGIVNSNWLKLKFSYLSSDITQTGYSVRFYKWRIVGTSSQLDSNPLQFASYNLSTGVSSNQLVSAVYATEINNSNGYYLQLNDDAQYPYQALKVVVYKSDGTVATQSDMLIPQFYTSPTDYQKNSDGSARSLTLQKLHPLYGTDVSALTTTQMKQKFDQYCF